MLMSPSSTYTHICKMFVIVSSSAFILLFEESGTIIAVSRPFITIHGRENDNQLL